MKMNLLQRAEATMVGRVLSASEARVQRATKDRWQVDGHALDRRTQYMFTVGRFAERSIPRMTPKGARAYYARLCRVLEAPPPRIGRTVELSIPMRSGPRPGRAYYPPRVGESDKSKPGLVYYHGGGFSIGSIDTHDTFCKRLCVEADCVVVSVDYRLAPEDPFPAAVEDCYDAYTWVRDHAIDLGIAPELVAVGGDSAGGNLSAAVCAISRDEHAPMPCAQLLIYPGVGDLDHPGRDKPELQSGYGLDARTLQWFAENYVPGGDTDNPLAAPLHLPSHQGLPPAIVATAQFDLLCGEGIDYVAKLKNAEVQVTHIHLNDLPHGFVTMSVLPRAREAITEIATALAAALHDQPPARATLSAAV